MGKTKENPISMLFGKHVSYVEVHSIKMPHKNVFYEDTDFRIFEGIRCSY